MPDDTNQDIVKDNQITQDRQEIIDTAVRFLNNPKVIPTPVENKRLFLSKKGLNENEIKIAFNKAGILETQEKSEKSPVTPDNNSIEIQNNSKKQVQVKTSIWFRLAKWIKNILLAGCLAYSAYKFLIQKYLFGRKSKTQSSADKMLLANQQLSDSIREMKITLNTLKQTIESMNGVVMQINAQKLNEDTLKNEIQSIKSLLLNRTQFPSLPSITPILPSWQLESKDKSIVVESENDKKESVNEDIKH